MKTQSAWPIFLVFLAVAVAFPLINQSPYLLGIGITAITFSLLAMSLNLVLGYGGLLSFGQVGFFGLGAYISALLVVDTHWSFWLAVPVAALVAGAFGLLIGFASLRLSRHAFVVVSLAMTVILELIAKDWSTLTRGPAGIPGLPSPEMYLPGIGRIVFNAPGRFYWLSLACAVVLLGLVYMLIRSPAGRLMKAVKMNESLAKSQGISPLPYRLLTIVVSALIAAVAGSLHVFNLTIVDPTIFHFYYAEAILIMVLLGGVGALGILIAAVVFSVVPEVLRIALDARSVIYGFILIGLMLYLPEGMAGLPQRWRTWRLQRKEASRA